MRARARAYVCTTIASDVIVLLVLQLIGRGGSANSFILINNSKRAGSV